ncbi:CPBP family intramembrane glutamic endopeptidase [Massilia scottii]|uniref:CPBP family intramembrane glutamic endopeptidase n=1 Tax=Massilia scottii TaxID=3057166 RepID=UPI002796DCB7|nr:CPBP family intramembrane glutamic endopeptidase [Massilia sp. CCM 9029]MDQ1831460.1 CPBP family intramembrane metalloprotease [Massilia sp. CCM 9029]
MLKTEDSVVPALSHPASVKVYEILIVWMVVTVAWHEACTYVGSEITNFIYLQWVGIVITMIFVTKNLIQRENLTFPKMMGNKISCTVFIELAIVIMATVLSGIACWALLVFFSAQINVEWAYRHWNLASASAFEEVKWLRSWLVLEVMTIVVIGPIIEEIIFRGFILRRFRQKYQLSYAILASSLLFGALHIDQSFLSSFFHGIIYAILAARFASLYAPIFVHGAYNAITFLMARGYGIFLVAEKSRIDSIGYWLPELALLPFCMIALVWYWKMFFRSNEAALPALVQRG